MQQARENASIAHESGAIRIISPPARIVEPELEAIASQPSVSTARMPKIVISRRVCRAPKRRDSPTISQQ
jgi:hypothetical protein